MYQALPPDPRQAMYAMMPATVLSMMPPTIMPRARPYFPGAEASPENSIRGYYEECCCGMRPGTGPNVPQHWFDGGSGWATAHFYDTQPFDIKQQLPGIHQCKYCNYVAEGEECCSKSICWCPLGKAPAKMTSHLVSMHGIAPPPKRQWATECTDTQGCCDILCCFPCQASRQINAAHGRANQLNVFWCLYFTLAFRNQENDDGKSMKQVSLFLAALVLRNAIITHNRIDEGCCTTLLMASLCPICSLAQTYREFSAAGVWPGGICNGDAPPAIMMNNPPLTMMSPAALVPALVNSLSPRAGANPVSSAYML